jgi:hypothetical protein
MELLQLLNRLLVIENARTENKRASRNAYDEETPAKRKTRKKGNGGSGGSGGGSDRSAVKKLIFDALVRGEIRELDDEIRDYLAAV